MSTQPRAPIGAIFREDRLVQTIKSLSARGWVPLSNMATILGYAHQESIFARQKTSRAIPYVRVGGVNRVNETIVVQLLEQQAAGEDTHCTEDRQNYAKIVLDLYRRIKNG